HQHRPRPPGQPTPRPTTTPTTSNTRMTHDINNNHDHTQATHQPPNNQPRDCGERHSGEAGRVTPGRGADRTRDHPTLDHQARPQPRIPTKPTPSTTTTASTTTSTSATSHTHDIEHSCGTHHRQRDRPPADNAAATHRPPNNQPRHCGVEHSGEAGRVTPGRGAAQGGGVRPKMLTRHRPG